MPRLVKGAKWVYAWTVIGTRGEAIIPPEALREFSFQVGGEAVFLPGSRRSGGFAVSTPRLMAAVAARMSGATIRILGRGEFDEDGRIVVPPEIGVKPGDRLLAVRGSRYALGFVVQGPIYMEALKHPDLEVFGEE